MIKGSLKCEPNARNNRDLIIEIDYKVEGKNPSQDKIEYSMCVILLHYSCLPFDCSRGISVDLLTRSLGLDSHPYAWFRSIAFLVSILDVFPASCPTIFLHTLLPT